MSDNHVKNKTESTYTSQPWTSPRKKDYPFLTRHPTPPTLSTLSH